MRNGAKAHYRPRQAWTTSKVTQVPPPELEPPEEPEPEPPEPPEPEVPEPEVPPVPELPAPEPPEPPVPAPDVPPEPEPAREPEPEPTPVPEPLVPEPLVPERPEPELEPEAGREVVPEEPLPDPELVPPEPEPVAWLTVPAPLDPAEPTGAEADLVPITPGSTELVASSPAEPAVTGPVSKPGAVTPGVSAAGLPWAAADPPWAEGRERCAVPPLPGRPAATPSGGAGTWPACGAEADGPCTSPPMTGV